MQYAKFTGSLLLSSYLYPRLVLKLTSLDMDRNKEVLILRVTDRENSI